MQHRHFTGIRNNELMISDYGEAAEISVFDKKTNTSHSIMIDKTGDDNINEVIQFLNKIKDKKKN